MITALSGTVLFLLLLLLGVICYAGWQRDMRLHDEALVEAAWFQAQEEAAAAEAEELASVGIYDWRHSGL